MIAQVRHRQSYIWSIFSDPQSHVLLSGLFRLLSNSNPGRIVHPPDDGFAISDLSGRAEPASKFAELSYQSADDRCPRGNHQSDCASFDENCALSVCAYVVDSEPTSPAATYPHRSVSCCPLTRRRYRHTAWWRFHLEPFGRIAPSSSHIVMK